MAFQAGIGCRYPLFCDIAAPLLGLFFLGLIGWFIVYLLINNRADHAGKHSSKRSNKTRKKR
jgi:zinc transporter ZupT